MTLLHQPPNLIMLNLIFMTGIPIIKAISMKGTITIQFQLSHHLKLTLKLFTRTCHSILIEFYSVNSI